MGVDAPYPVHIAGQRSLQRCMVEHHSLGVVTLHRRAVHAIATQLGCSGGADGMDSATAEVVDQRVSEARLLAEAEGVPRVKDQAIYARLPTEHQRSCAIREYARRSPQGATQR